MDATLALTINPQNAVPAVGRTAWLEQHGVLPDTSTIEITAPISVWSDAGATLTPAGQIENADAYSGQSWGANAELRDYLRTTIAAQIAATGAVPTILGPRPV